MEVKLLLLVVSLLFTYYLLYNILRWSGNVRTARKSNLKVIPMPTHEMNPFFLLGIVFGRRIVKRLPFGLSQSKYLRFYWKDWAFQTDFEQFEEYGDVFSIASPAGTSVFVANADVANQIFMRRNDFPKDTRLYDWVRFYGDNILTLEGPEWRRHRKITSPPFNEAAINAACWKETISQASTALSIWLEGPKILVGQDMKTITRNIISFVGFGVKLGFESENGSKSDVVSGGDRNEHFGLRHVPEGHSLSYASALDHILGHALVYALSPKWLLRHGPKVFKDTKRSYDELGVYLRTLLSRERDHLEIPGSKRNLLGSMEDRSRKFPTAVLSDDEWIGNIFIFVVAGVETTAGSLHYALILLALHQETQDWLHKDLRECLAGQSKDPAEWDYEEVFPKLISPVCVIYETLRIYSTHQYLPKWTADKPQAFTFKDKTVTLPPRTTVYITVRGLHFNPEYWGDNVKEFAPQKWDLREGPNAGWTRKNPKTGVEVPTTPPEDITEKFPGKKAPYNYIRTPVKGSYAPFSDGARACLGKQFGLVLMAAVLAVSFRDYRVRVKRRDGESQEDADARGMRDLKESSYSIETVMLRNDIEVEWTRRE